MGRQIAALMLAMLLLCGTALGEGEFPELNGQGFLDEGEFLYENPEEGVWRYVSPTLRVEILRYTQETSCSLILVTHSLQQARRVADEVLFFHKGILTEAGPKAQVLFAPSQPETRQFLDFYGI